MVDLPGRRLYIGIKPRHPTPAGPAESKGSAMSGTLVQILILAGIAIFLILRLRSVLGTRDGFEPPRMPDNAARPAPRRAFDVIEGGVDDDIADHVKEGSAAARALADMKAAEPSFSVGEFLRGARGAYEMILTAFEDGRLGDVESFLAPEVRNSFAAAIAERESQGLTVESHFAGIRDVTLVEARFDTATREAEIDVRFTAELATVVKDADGQIVEGDANALRRQRDVWTFGRMMGSDNPNWALVGTGG
jgi:predicted lipid-binding transport protein (Tim44 family)